MNLHVVVTNNVLYIVLGIGQRRNGHVGLGTLVPFAIQIVFFHLGFVLDGMFERAS